MPISRDALYPLAEPGYRFRRGVHAQWTGEKRPPKAGEWFLSGAVIEAYLAAVDLTTSYHIARLVFTRTIIEVIKD
jgi:hypothetical protein